LFIVNQVAGAGKCKRKWSSFKALLNRGQVEFNEAFSEDPGHAYKLARNSVGDYEVLAAVGGDGTVREVADGIISAKKDHVALAVVPFGTGNDLAQVLGVRTESDAVQAIKTGVIRSIDVIQISCQAEGETRPNICARMVRSPSPPPNGGEGRGEEALDLQPSDLRSRRLEVPGQGVVRHALLFAGAGVIAAALRKTTPSLKRLLGQRLAYPIGLFAALLDYRAQRMRVTFDGTTLEEDFLFVGASNTEIAGGGMRVAPGAVIDDGVLNLNLISAMGRWSALLQLRRVARGRHLSHPKVRHLTARSVRIETAPPVDIAADGDLIGHSPAQIAVKPRALRVLARPG